MMDGPPVLCTSTRPAIFHRSWQVMHTRFSMVLVGIDNPQAEALAHFTENELRTQEQLMSRFDTTSPVSELNRHSVESDFKPPAALWEILRLCREYWERTGGAFDITQWPLNHLWRKHLERGEQPAPQDIARFQERSGMQNLALDQAARTVRFLKEGMSIDLGGFGKGLALERLAQSLRTHGVKQALLSFGESSITVLGSHPHGPAWPVGITNVFDPSDIVHTFHLKNGSLSSSGTAPFNSMGGARRFGQIIDPRSGRPIEGYRTMSVASPSGIEAEVLSTALLVTPEHKRARLLSEFPAASAIEFAYQLSKNDFVPVMQWRYDH